MPKQEYNRYAMLKNNDGTSIMMPYVEIPVSPADKYEEWKEGFSRMDVFSEKYYNNPFDDFFIMLSNPQYISEFDIPDGTIIRIPFPIERAKAIYENYLSNIRDL